MKRAFVLRDWDGSAVKARKGWELNFGTELALGWPWGRDALTCLGCRFSCAVAMRALGFEPKKEEIKKMIADIDKASWPRAATCMKSQPDPHHRATSLLCKLFPFKLTVEHC